MKEIKFLLWSLYVAVYTSLCWATLVFDGMYCGGTSSTGELVNGIYLGWFFFGIFTFINLVVSFFYVIFNWNDNNGMKEIKFLLWSLYIAAYTSLWWGVFIFDGIRSPANNTMMGVVILVPFTIVNIIIGIRYLYKHWDDQKENKNV